MELVVALSLNRVVCVRHFSLGHWPLSCCSSLLRDWWFPYGHSFFTFLSIYLFTEGLEPTEDFRLQSKHRLQSLNKEVVVAFSMSPCTMEYPWTCGSNLGMLEAGDDEGSPTITNFKFVGLRIVLLGGAYYKIRKMALQKIKITIKMDTTYWRWLNQNIFKLLNLEMGTWETSCPSNVPKSFSFNVFWSTIKRKKNPTG